MTVVLYQLWQSIDTDIDGKVNFRSIARILQKSISTADQRTILIKTGGDTSRNKHITSAALLIVYGGTVIKEATEMFNGKTFIVVLRKDIIIQTKLRTWQLRLL